MTKKLLSFVGPGQRHGSPAPAPFSQPLPLLRSAGALCLSAAGIQAQSESFQNALIFRSFLQQLHFGAIYA